MTLVDSQQPGFCGPPAPLLSSPGSSRHLDLQANVILHPSGESSSSLYPPSLAGPVSGLPCCRGMIPLEVPGHFPQSSWWDTPNDSPMFSPTPLHGVTTPEGSGSWQRCDPFSDQWSNHESELYSLWMETPLGISSQSILPSLFLGLTLGQCS